MRCQRAHFVYPSLQEKIRLANLSTQGAANTNNKEASATKYDALIKVQYKRIIRRGFAKHFLTCLCSYWHLPRSNLSMPFLCLQHVCALDRGFFRVVVTLCTPNVQQASKICVWNGLFVLWMLIANPFP
jgi:hypothetical protein